MGALDGEVAIITGAGNGIGREHALLFAREGARVVVNDPGGDRHGFGASGAADRVVEEIRAAGGQAVASREAVGKPAAAATAVDAFGAVRQSRGRPTTRRPRRTSRRWARSGRSP